ncbi:unnamed protein product [Rotaria socialis]
MWYPDFHKLTGVGTMRILLKLDVDLLITRTLILFCFDINYNFNQFHRLMISESASDTMSACYVTPGSQRIERFLWFGQMTWVWEIAGPSDSESSGYLYRTPNE